jgi:UDPglucose 6-dehydrogenase
LRDVSSLSEIIFLSVPTPAKTKDGSIDLKILDSVLNDISNNLNGNEPIVLIRSTVVPGTSRKFKNKYKRIKIVFNPEFLTERSAKLDFINQSRIVLGGSKKDTQVVAELFSKRFGSHLPIIQTDFETAELVKYMCNCFFATKVSFMNEMYRISNKINANWEDAVAGFHSDGRIGKSHLTVPGFDGKMGYGGSCFPKDVQAMIAFSKELGIVANTVQASWKTNLEVRPEKDWEKLKGRAVSESE